MKIKNTKTLILIGGIDPTGNAGLFADAKVMQHYKMPFYAIPTAVTAQSDIKFFGSEPVSISLFRQQLKILPPQIHGVKIGMLATLQHTKILRDWLKKTKPKFVVWDPVLCSSSGGVLLNTKQWNPTLQKLLKQCHIFTPNIPEAEWILGRKLNANETRKWVQEAAKDIFQQARSSNLKGVLIKGGHAASSSPWMKDIFWDGKSFTTFRSKRKNMNPRGTGCTLASAILTELSLGKDLVSAIHNARSYVQKYLFQ